MEKLLIFFVTSVSSALMNYFFQVLLAYKIGPVEFSQFTLNWSYLGLASVLGGFFQYWASLNKVSPKDEKKIKSVVHFAAVFLLFISVFLSSITFLILSIVVEGIAMAFIIGRAMRGGDFKTINIINISLAFLRVLFVFLIPSAFLNSIKIFYIVFTSFVLVEIIYYNFMYIPEIDIAIPIKKRTGMNWSGPLLFSILISTLPQIDIIWVHWFKTPQSLNLISELSFITKGLFFFQLIIAQWLFPKQMLEPTSRKFNIAKYLIIFFVILLAGSLIGSFLLPFLLMRFLSWTIIPSHTECFYAGVNAGMMSLFYQFCQINIIRNKLNYIFFSLIGFLGVLSISGLFNLSLNNYYIVSSSTYLVIMGISFLVEKDADKVL